MYICCLLAFLCCTWKNALKKKTIILTKDNVKTLLTANNFVILMSDVTI